MFLLQNEAKDLQAQVKAKKHEISLKNKEIHAAQNRQDQIKKSSAEWQLEIKRLKLDSEKLKSTADNSEQMVSIVILPYLKS